MIKDALLQGNLDYVKCMLKKRRKVNSSYQLTESTIKFQPIK